MSKLRSIVTLLTIVILAPAASGQTFTWNGGGSNPKWSTGGNWVGGSPPPTTGGTADIVFTGSTQLNPTMNAVYDINTLSFLAAAGAFTLSTDGTPSHILTIENGLTQQSPNLQTLTNATILGNSQTWNLSGGDLTVSGRLSGATAGAGLTVAGSGTLTLSNTSNTYSGGTTVSSGTLQLGAANAVPATGTFQLSGGRLSSGATTGFSNNFGPMAINANSTIALGTGSHVLRFTGLTVIGTPSLTISGWLGVQGTAGTAGELIFSGLGATPNSTYASFLSGVQFTSYPLGATFIPAGAGNFELTPVPEPATIFGLSALALGLGRGFRRWTARA